MKKLLAIATAATLLSACASTSTTAPVITRADGVHETTGLGATKTKAQESALAAAKKQCGIRSPIVVSDKMTYNGILNERTGRMIEQGVSVAGAIFGQSAPKLSRDDDFEYTVKFRCQ
ncbi:hypothetical protein AO372_0891 [Moraxella catarrhalis]|uniref:hypothetical protein n=1 Tax=Moraxella catarrhalis TaxID=480 RepID=UPI0007E4C498|nr:hypothetical protein [Moraxella catarrhalis]OAV21573.1 hypothetical protein AO372_0891 [Moraxella catarrhalis]